MALLVELRVWRCAALPAMADCIDEPPCFDGKHNGRDAEKRGEGYRRTWANELAMGRYFADRALFCWQALVAFTASIVRVQQFADVPSASRGSRMEMGLDELCLKQEGQRQQQRCGDPHPTRFDVYGGLQSHGAI